MKIKEFNDEIIFLHEIIDGAADRSYGIHVAKLAGMPAIVIKRAQSVLSMLEREHQNVSFKDHTDELPLFSSLKKEEDTGFQNKAVAALKDINPDNLSPREALDELYKLKEMLKC